jgi:hypothetical protein
VLKSVLIFAIGAALCGLSCKDEVLISGQDALVDPNVMPHVSYVSPPMNSVGPYVGWGDFPNESYTFLLRFNKLMEPASVYGGLVLRSSMKPVAFRTPYFDPAVKSSTFQFEPRDSGSYEFTPLIGEVFTVEVGQPMQDVNGNAISSRVLGTFEPEPYFRATGAWPDSGSLVSGAHYVVIAFNSRVDTSILSSILVDPPVSLQWMITWYSPLKVAAWLKDAPSGPLRVTVPAGVHDASGHVLQAAFTWSLRVAGFAVTNLYPNTYYLEEPLYVVCSSAIDPSTASGAVDVSPPIPGGYNLSVTENEMKVVPNVSWAPATAYRVSIDTTLRSTGGSHLVSPASTTFTTFSFLLASSSPYDGQTRVSRTTDVILSFNAVPDTATLRHALSFDPPVVGTVGFQSPRVGTFVLSDAFAPNTTYTVTVDTSLRTRGGYPLASPARFTFTTAGLAQ